MRRWYVSLAILSGLSWQFWDAGYEIAGVVKFRESVEVRLFATQRTTMILGDVGKWRIFGALDR